MLVTYQGNINVSDLGMAMLVGIVVGLTSAVPLIWLSWRIPQQIFAQECVTVCLPRFDPAICAFSWPDALFVVLLCASAVGVAATKGVDLEALMTFYYCAILLLLARIDARTYLLPDILTLSLLWAGLLWHAADWGGAVPGPVSLGGSSRLYYFMGPMCVVKGAEGQTSDGAWRL